MSILKDALLMLLICTVICFSLCSCELVGTLADEIFGHTVPPSAPPCEHVESEWIIDKEATCLEAGERHTQCALCESIIKERYYREHTYECGVCTACGVLRFSEGLEYTFDDWGGFYIVSGIGTCDDTDIIIPSEHNGFPVLSISSNAFCNNSDVVSLVLSEGFGTVEPFAFEGCTSLRVVKLCNGVTIEPYSFRGCSSLEEINIPENVRIGSCAFKNCSPSLRAVFADAENWYSGPIGWVGGSAISSSKLSDPTLAGQYLLSTENYIWRDK